MGDELQTRLIGFVLDNWDTIATAAVLGLGLIVTWLKKRAALDAVDTVVTNIESVGRTPPTNKMLTIPYLKKLIESAAKQNPGAAKVIENAVQKVDPKN